MKRNKYKIPDGIDHMLYVATVLGLCGMAFFSIL